MRIEYDKKTPLNLEQASSSYRKPTIKKGYQIDGYLKKMVPRCTRIFLAILCLLIVPLCFEAIRKPLFKGYQVICYCSKIDSQTLTSRKSTFLLPIPINNSKALLTPLKIAPPPSSPKTAELTPQPVTLSDPLSSSVQAKQETQLAPLPKPEPIAPVIPLICPINPPVPNPHFRHGLDELYVKRGAHFSDDKTTFEVFAPNAQMVECVIADKRDLLIFPMTKIDGSWIVTLKNVRPGCFYIYKITSKQKEIFTRIDPFSFSTQFNTLHQRIHSVVVDRNQFQWTDHKWCQERTLLKPIERPLSIYELDIKSWNRNNKENLAETAQKIALYCLEIGFTHVELYGILDHVDQSSRGYRVTNFFAPYNAWPAMSR